MYDVLSGDYDRFVNWESRLGAELPFLIEQLLRVSDSAAPGNVQVLDAACGTGQHAIALAQHGFTAAGADLSPGMIAQARINARHAGQELRFETAGFGDLQATFGAEFFNALLCLGNSLPHAVTGEALDKALADFAAVLRQNGLLILQNRNFDSVMAQRARWMEPQAHREPGTEWLFLRFYDFEPEGTIAFHVVTLKRNGEGPWSQQETTTRLRPLLEADLVERLDAAGFTGIDRCGSMSGERFDPLTSGNLVVTARKRG